MSLKNLPIDRLLLEGAIENSNTIKIISKEIKPNNLIIYKISDIENSSRLGQVNVYYNKDATTSFNAQGKDLPFVNSFLEQIIPLCLKGDNKHKTLTFSNVDSKKLEIIKEFLIEVCNATFEEIPLKHSKNWVFKGLQGDTITLCIYNTNKLVIQGKQQFLFTDLIEILSEVFELEDVILQQLKIVDVNVTIKDTLKEFKDVFTHSHGFLGEGLTAIICPALTLRKLNITLTDYSCLVFPALRGLEGYIKKALETYGIIVSKEGIGEHFEQIGNSCRLKEESKKGIELSIRITFGNLYLYYKSNRHGLFHTDVESKISRKLESKLESDKILNSVIKLIEESYITLAVK